ncbi:MAG: Glutamyl-tRNA(Gln) amidotransferase subunit E [Candidatus Thorarchaeota archaeon]|nr:MAG: Glutamyl-tRNA(Gln) amidotransferase subunit E [Candidatus Thorarchaeota archaeon]
MTDEERFQELGLMVGLELHQQLDTPRKLYCHCPTIIREDEPHGGFVRRLRPTQSEMGTVDPAALFEFQRKKSFYYEFYNDSTCLVEADEEPPHDLCGEAIDICLTMAVFLNSVPVDEIHPMRKIVIDGSNTTGFQRTAIIATGGSLLVNGKAIGIQTLCLEEDAARKIDDDEKNNRRVYRLDRLGIPLIEIATAPDIRSPEEAQEVALALGLLMRSTGKVKRGLGTIRQDVNISIEGGGIIEIKGLQQLNMLSTVVELEVQRQVGLLEIKQELEKRNIHEDMFGFEPVDVTDVFSGCESKLIKRAINSGDRVFATRLSGFDGLVGKELQPERRFGTELSDYAKFWGRVGGIFHSDELPKYGITTSEVEGVQSAVEADSHDAVVIVAASEKNCLDALEAVNNRARAALLGIPAETRVPLPSGASKYARPRPGAERMYPETDVRPVRISSKKLKSIKKSLPETLVEKEKRFIREYNLSPELASQITRSLNLSLFEEIVSSLDVDPTLVAVTLENTLVSLARDEVPIDSIKEQRIVELFEFIEKGNVSSEAISEILKFLANHPSKSISHALKETGLSKVDVVDLEEIIHKIVEERVDFIKEQGERSIGGLMGVAMKELRGKADGKKVKSLLQSEIQRVLAE